MTEIRSFLLDNTVQHYDWGTKNAHAYIASLLGVEPRPDTPYAELWIGAHPKAPSSVRKNSDHIPLPDFISLAPRDVLGSRAAEHFNHQLPFLLKVLSAGAPLSIQAHPDKALAAQLHARDPKNYPDANHKPEIAVALTELTALAGFKPFRDLVHTVERYRPLAEAAGSEAVDRLRADVSADAARQQEVLRFFFTTLMERLQADPGLLERSIDTLDDVLCADTSGANVEEREFFFAFRKLYRYDIGLLSMLLLNIVHCKKGEGLFLGPGIPHAYIEGSIVECMANSDNVVRAGLTPKFKDVETLCRMLTYECGAPELLRPVINPDGSGLTVYPSPAAEFSLARRVMNESDAFTLDDRRVLEILLVIEGSVSLVHEGGRQLFKQGDTVLIPAALSRYELTAHTHAELFVASIPD
ncbi:MAG TPA: mannose-6-phosphate isomerase, class I [Bacteroidota bacterium]|nr:mannose-6-phosphate isomerase, class I [Bacteroidota bacterium]